jgi:site-specific DNA-methyltransferase (adenine-specific)
VGNVTLYNEDAFDVMARLPEASVDLIVTSPRYNVGMDYGELSDDTDWPTYYAEMERFLTLSYRLLRDGGVIAINVPKEVRLRRDSIEQIGRRVEKIAVRVELMCERLGFLPREAIVWVKGKEDTGPIATSYAMGSDNNIYVRPTCEMILLHSKSRYYYDNGTGRRGTKDVPFLDETKDVWWNVPARQNGHPAAFPVEIPQRLIQMFTCLKDGARIPVVLDCFMGSGSTGVAAVRTGRDFIGCEINRRFFENARGRIAGTALQLPLRSNNEMKLTRSGFSRSEVDSPDGPLFVLPVG